MKREINILLFNFTGGHYYIGYNSGHSKYIIYIYIYNAYIIISTLYIILFGTPQLADNVSCHHSVQRPLT